MTLYRVRSVVNDTFDTFAPDFGGDFGAFLRPQVMNHQKGVVSACPIRAPGVGMVREQYLEDTSDSI